ncbi:MAG: hypothetical protein SCARUB_02416 [Candidatus Scalindua rubra]|uniref:Uncharacterized protein n=1 Tax=Candidatus Scalindua rubra TaxID=1872076 RepID=A0A1E3XA35_9BACT|nr:MAG: hypothetical protein SCARUB_02416 [Candidatus Scalindua rubra]
MMSSYLPVTLSSIQADTIIGCDIYLLVHDNGKGHYVLYCKGDTVFENGKREMLVRKNIDRLFIGENDRKKYSKYVELNLQNILYNKNIRPNERSQIIYSTATNLIQDVFEYPVLRNIERSKAFAYNMIDYIIRDEKAAYSLLKITSHDYYIYTHSVNVAAIGSLFARNIGLNEKDLKSFCTGMLLHDLGKTRISPDIINKKGKLTKDEYEEVKVHPAMGVKILKEAGNGLKDEYVIILQHHENCDGSGYPYGLKKEEIHAGAKIVRMIDTYDALSTKRSYSNALMPYDSLKKIKNEMRNIVDLNMFKRFIRFLGGYGW